MHFIKWDRRNLNNLKRTYLIGRRFLVEKGEWGSFEREEKEKQERERLRLEREAKERQERKYFEQNEKGVFRNRYYF